MTYIETKANDVDIGDFREIIRNIPEVKEFIDNAPNSFEEVKPRKSCEEELIFLIIF